LSGTPQPETPMLRPSEPSETPALLALAEGTGVFKPIEIQALAEVLTDYHACERAKGHRCVTAWQDEHAIGFAYWAPEEMTDRTWTLWWIAVRRDLQSQGAGARLLHACENDVSAAGGRLLLIETSGLPNYEPTLRFYAKHGYEPPSVIPDYYADGDDLLVFRKRLL
jgi:ribosomal protein S18 acetylase RimI-like enzyme